MIVIFSLASLMRETASAWVAKRRPAYVAMLEGGAGMLMVAGLALLGAALPFVP